MSFPKISIVIVVFNAAKTLEDTIISVAKQSYNNWELIVIDGASTDGTVDIIKSYSSVIHYWLSEADNGIYDAMNKSLNYIGGDYVYFLGADDIFIDDEALKNFSSYLTTSALKKESTVFYGDVIYKSINRTYDGEFNDLKFCLRNICHQAILYPRNVFENHRYDTAYKYLADFVLNLKIKATKLYDFKYVPVTLALYNDTGSSGSNKDKLFLKNRLELIKQAFPLWIYLYASLRFKIKRLLNG